MVNIVRNLKKNGIELTFDSKPTYDILQWLKSNKYRWSSFQMVWWKKFDQNSWDQVHAQFNQVPVEQPVKPISTEPIFHGVTFNEFIMLDITASLKSFARDEHLKRNIVFNEKDSLRQSLTDKGLMKRNGAITDMGRKTRDEVIKDSPYNSGMYYSGYDKIKDKWGTVKSEPEFIQEPIKTIISDIATQEVEQERVESDIPGSIRPDFMINKPMIKGREIQISMPNGEKRNALFAIVELNDIIASHNEDNFHSEPDYPKNATGNNINDRNYKDDLAAQKAVMDYARELEPERLITTSRTPSGTPIITKDGFVVSGNNRTMSLKLAAKQYPDNYIQYKKFLAEEAESFGFERSFVSQDVLVATDKNNKTLHFNYPVLVRIDLDFPQYTTQELAKYNKDTKKAERPIDKAIKLSNILRDNSRCAEIIADITGEYETFSEFYANIVAQKRLAKTLVECNLLTEQELPAYFSDTTFTETGKEFIEGLLAALILDREALMATEQPGVKTTRQKLITSLPVLMKNANLPEGSLKKNINDAVILQQIIKTSGSEFADFIRQANLFGTTYEKKTVYLNRLIDSGKFKFKQAIEGYNDAIIKNQGASLFGDKPSTEDVFNHWIKGNVSDIDQRLIEASKLVSGNTAMESRPEPKFNVGEYVKYEGGDTFKEYWSGVIREVKDLGTEYVYRIDAYAKNEDGQVLFDDAKNNEKYEVQLSKLATESNYTKLKEQYDQEQQSNNIIKQNTPIDEARAAEEKHDKIHTEFLRFTNDEDPKDRFKIYLVNGNEVRKDHIEFTMGGHGYVYDYVPKDEIWIDENLKDKPDDMEATIKHEVFEVHKMRDEGLDYESAHELANAMEEKVRKDPETSDKTETKDDIAEARLKKLMLLRKFISVSQHEALSELMMGEEGEAGWEIIDRLGSIIETMPHTYQTENTETEDKIVHLHYFNGGSDWYIVEKDKLPVQNQAFGYAILNGDSINAEWGYVSILELIQNNVELDFYWTPKKFGEIIEKKEKRQQGNVNIDLDVIDAGAKNMSRSEFLNSLHELDLWKEFEGRHYRKFLLSEKGSRAVTDLGIKESMRNVKKNGIDYLEAIISIPAINSSLEDEIERAYQYNTGIEVTLNKPKELQPISLDADIIMLIDILDSQASAKGKAQIWNNGQQDAEGYPVTASRSRIVKGVDKTLWQIAAKAKPVIEVKSEGYEDRIYWLGSTLKQYIKKELREKGYELVHAEPVIDNIIPEKQVEPEKETLADRFEESKAIGIERILTTDYANEFELNKAIEELIDTKWHIPLDQWSADELKFIAGYTGYGGLDKFGEITKGSLFEYFTPDQCIEKMWGLAYKYGYTNGPVLEPSCGIGPFFDRRFVSNTIEKHGYEINKYSAKIAKLLYPEAIINDGEEVKYFEQLFIIKNYTVRNKVTPRYRLVIGNPPYGTVGGIYMGMGEKAYTHANNYIDYFILRGLDLLEKGGLLIYIIGAETAGGGVPFLDQGMNKVKEMIMERGKLIDAYRLPSGVFARTEVTSDIVVFRRR